LNLKVNRPTGSAKAPALSIGVAFWFAVLTVVGIWPALTNGQPFFFMDTTAYVRGADVAISKVLGARFATDWAKDPRRRIERQNTAAVSEAAQEQKPSRRFVSSGRSIVYGALLYLGEIFKGMWFSIVMQSLLAVYLVFILTVKVLNLDFRCFLLSCAVLFFFSSLPFFISFLMPDVFSGFLILGFAILATSWERLSRFDRAAISGVLLFAVLAHHSHLVVLVVMTAVAIGYVVLVDRSQWTRVRGLLAVSVACILIFVLWDAAFTFGVTRAFGIPPVRPPFLLGKLVTSLDKSAVAKVCASKDFVICKYQDRLPIDQESFVWNEDQRRGIFGAADFSTKRALGAEQFRFALAFIPPNLGPLAAAVSLDVLRELGDVGLEEFFYPSYQLPFFEERLPGGEFRKLTSTAAARSDVYVVFGSTVLRGAALLSAILLALLFAWAVRSADGNDAMELGQRRTWRAVTCILLGGVVLNAVVCGGLSTPHDRYESRVIWLIQLLLVTGLYVMKPVWKVARHTAQENALMPAQ
jgi:hypothetical protein